VSSIQPELWVERADQALRFYRDAFGATVLHHVGEGSDMVAQLAIGDAMFWIATANREMGRFSPEEIKGATSRILLVVDDPDSVVRTSIEAGATQKAAVNEEHGWRVGRIIDPFGHEWEVGRPTGPWPPIDR
jgi:PhnB protein